ncbi:hypothetical protein L2E82_10820 [Cichorium intybus]|uniref:Uncharacterized protein n=1 Tax=Cichorium intybus TaxID=13427 RepID=A0ACB9GCN5_CICIN|nr:hypothetical protein L2E82_10820 [Cichorium intybus]
MEEKQIRRHNPASNLDLSIAVVFSFTAYPNRYKAAIEGGDGSDPGFRSVPNPPLTQTPMPPSGCYMSPCRRHRLLWPSPPSIDLFMVNDWIQGAVILVAFFMSAVFHELCIAVPCHIFKFWAFIGIMFQVPLVILTNYLQRKVYDAFSSKLKDIFSVVCE